MAIHKPAPRVDLCKGSDTIHVIPDASSSSADTDLREVSGKPKWAPQKLTLIAGAAAAAIILTPEKGAAITITVPIGGVVVIQHPINKIVDSGTGAVQVICECSALAARWIGIPEPWRGCGLQGIEHGSLTLKTESRLHQSRARRRVKKMAPSPAKKASAA